MCTVENMVRINSLGSGKSADVYKVKDNLSDRNFALKIFKNQQEFENEKKSLQNLQHTNLVQSFQIQDPHYILMEYCENLTLFEYIKLGIQFPETIVRHYFKQLLNGIEYMHEKGFVHRDIKLDNILLNSHFQLKLADFGFTIKIGKRGEKLNKICGTKGYFAPEQLQKQDHFGQSSDIFQMGVVLFTMMNGVSPYLSEATIEDPYYKLIMEKKYNRFWMGMESHLQKKLSVEFKDLINKMLACKVDERITLQEIREHKWLNMQNGSEEDTKSFMQDLRYKIQVTKESMNQI